MHSLKDLDFKERFFPRVTEVRSSEYFKGRSEKKTLRRAELSMISVLLTNKTQEHLWLYKIRPHQTFGLAAK